MDSKRFNEVLEGVIDKCRHTRCKSRGIRDGRQAAYLQSCCRNSKPYAHWCVGRYDGKTYRIGL